MKQRGRKSEASKEVEGLREAIPTRPDPPPTLTANQKVVWYSVVDSMPPGWFNPSHYGELAGYCEHVSYARQLAQMMNVQEVESPEGQAMFCKLSTAHATETRASTALARAMRLTHQAKYDPTSAFRKAENAAERLPWESH